MDADRDPHAGTASDLDADADGDRHGDAHRRRTPRHRPAARRRPHGDAHAVNTATRTPTSTPTPARTARAHRRHPDANGDGYQYADPGAAEHRRPVALLHRRPVCSRRTVALMIYNVATATSSSTGAYGFLNLPNRTAHSCRARSGPGQPERGHGARRRVGAAVGRRQRSFDARQRFACDVTGNGSSAPSTRRASSSSPGRLARRASRRDAVQLGLALHPVASPAHAAPDPAAAHGQHCQRGGSPRSRCPARPPAGLPSHPLRRLHRQLGARRVPPRCRRWRRAATPRPPRARPRTADGLVPLAARRGMAGAVLSLGSHLRARARPARGRRSARYGAAGDGSMVSNLAGPGWCGSRSRAARRSTSGDPRGRHLGGRFRAAAARPCARPSTTCRASTTGPLPTFEEEDTVGVRRSGVARPRRPCSEPPHRRGGDGRRPPGATESAHVRHRSRILPVKADDQ